MAATNKQTKKGRRGLASANLETRLRVARSGGNAKHELRSLEGAS